MRDRDCDEGRLTHQLFVLGDIKIFPVSHSECIAHHSVSNKITKISAIDAENAQLCQHFLSIEEHVEVILGKASKLKQSKEGIRESLMSMLDEGLLATPLQFTNKLKSLPRKSAPNKSWKDGWVLAICTADRSFLVERLLRTIAPHLDALPSKPKLCLIDDSRSEDCSNQLVNIVNIIKAFSKKNALKAEFWSRKKRIQFSVELSEKIPECRDSIDYLLSPSFHPDGMNTTGQARNFATLMANGLPFLMVDDDCLIAPFEESDDKSTLSIGYSGRKGRVSSSYEGLFNSLVKSALNPFSEHLDRLGKTLPECLTAGNNKLLDVSYWKGKSRKDIMGFNENDFVGLTVNSIAGALNSRKMNWFYQSTGKDLKHATSLLGSLDNDTEQFLDQATWNGRPDDEVSRDIPFIGTTICGVSSLPIVPPMPPVGRNQDLALGALIKFLYSRSQVYQFGWGLPHLPEPKRQWQPFK